MSSAFSVQGPAATGSVSSDVRRPTKRSGVAVRRLTLYALLVCLVAMTGCVKQLLLVETTPPGAKIFYNGHYLGESPLTTEFLWYEPYRLRVEHAEYSPLQENGVLKAPPWLWFPLDGVMAVLPLPFRDRHRITFDFQSPQPEHIAAVMEAAESPPTHTGLLEDLRRIHQQRPARHDQ